MTNIKYVLRGNDEFQAYLKSLPRGVTRVALQAGAKYMLGDSSHGLKHYEPYKYVTPFKSYSPNKEKAAAQRRWIFAHLDQIGQNNRTNATVDAWSFKDTNNGYGVTFENPSEGAKWLWSDSKQTRQNAAVGHRTLSEKVSSNIAGTIRAAQQAVNRFIKGGS